MSRRMRTVIALLSVLVASAAAASAASADVPIRAFGLLPGTTQAGGHPDLQFGVSMQNTLQKNREEGYETECACENARFVTVHAPTGVVGNAHATPLCTAADFAVLSCSPNSQIGIVEAGLSIGFFDTALIHPIYNIEPRTKDPGLLGVNSLGVKIYYIISGRTGSDYGLDTTVQLPNGFPVYIVNNVLWGVPASEEHNNARFQYQTVGTLFHTLCDDNGTLITPNLYELSTPPNGPSHGTRGCNVLGGSPPYEPDYFFGQTPQKSTAPEVPFIENSTNCGEPLYSSVDVTGYDTSGQSAESEYPPPTGCDSLEFNPSLAAKPTTTEADSPSGLDVVLSVPQPQAAKTPSPSEIRATTITLPEGFTINSNAADGKVACEDLEAKIGINSQEAAECPDFSKIGSLEVDTSLLPGPARRLRVPRRAEARQSLPDLPRRRRLRHPRQVRRRGAPGPGHRPDRDQLQRPAPVAVLGVPAAHIRRRARDPGDADAMRHVPGRIALRALGQRSARPGRDPVLHDRLRAQRDPLPGSRAAVRPELRIGIDEQHRRLLQPAVAQRGPRRRQPVPLRARREHAARLLGRPEGDPLLSAVGDRPAGQLELQRPRRAALAGMSGGQPDRDRRRGRRRRVAGR